MDKFFYFQEEKVMGPDNAFKDLEKYRQVPIPMMEELFERKQNYRDHNMNLDSELNKEGHVEIKSLNLAGENYYHKTSNPPYYTSIGGSIPQVYLRKSVAEKFRMINKEKLNPFGLEIYVYDGFRPMEVQNYFHDKWFPKYLQGKNPNLEGEELKKEVENYWAPGGETIDPKSPPPHSTGAAVDLTIRYIESGQLLNMGSIFDDVTPSAHPDYFEKQSKERDLTFTEEDAMKNRRILYWLLIEQDFIVNPTEYWHGSWKDQMWAKLKNEEAAEYSNLVI